MKIKTLIAGIALSLSLPFAASAATVINVTTPVAETIADGGTYGTVITPGISLSADVVTQVDTDTDATLGIQFSPVPARGNLSIAINSDETSNYGTFMAYVSQDAVLDGGDVGGTLNSIGNFQFGDFSDLFTSSPFYVIVTWENDVQDDFSFNAFVEPIPVPAAGFLLLGGLGGLAALKRRKKA